MGTNQWTVYKALQKQTQIKPIMELHARLPVWTHT